jgi:hypothetical protein
MIGEEIVTPDTVPTCTHSVVPGRRPVSAAGREPEPVSRMVQGPPGDEDTSAIQGRDGAPAGQARVAVQPRVPAGQDHDDRNDGGGGDETEADDAPDPADVVTLGSARLQSAKK